jgi:ribosome-binding factor A
MPRFTSVSIGTDDEVKGSLAALKHANGFIRHQLGVVIRMRHTAGIAFCIR